MQIEHVPELPAETAYLFRHALLRDAAYQLQLPSARAALHGLALGILVDLFGDRTRSDSLQHVAFDLANHARNAAAAEGLSQDRRALLGKMEIDFLRQAAKHAQRQFDQPRAIECNERLADRLPAGSDEALDARLEAVGAHEFSGEYRRAIEKLEALQAGSQGGLKPSAECRLLAALGTAYSYVDRNADGEAVLARALSLANQLGDERLEAAVLRGMAAIAYNTSNDQEHKRCLGRVLEIHRKSGDRLAVARTLIEVATSGRDYADSTQKLNEGLELARSLDRPDLVAFALVRLSSLRFKQGQPREAMQLALDALDIARRVGHRRTESEVLSMKAEINFDCGNPEHAEDDLLAKIALCREIHDAYGVARSYVHLTNHYTDRGRYDEARKAGQAAIRIFREIGNSDGLAAAQLNVANAYVAMGDLDAAWDTYRDVLAYRRARKNTKGETTALINMTQVLLGRGQMGRSLATAQLSRQVIENSFNPMIAGYTHLAAAKVHMLFGELEASSRDIDAASQLFESGTAIRATAHALLPLKLRLAVTQGRMDDAKAALAQMREVFTRDKYLENSELGQEIRSGRRLVELPQAAPGQSPLGHFNGHLPEELTPRLRLALMDRLAKVAPEQLVAMREEDPTLFERMRVDTSDLDVPDWEGQDVP